MKKNTYLNNVLASAATTIASRVTQHVGNVGLRSYNAGAALVTIKNHPDDSIDVLRRTLELTHSGAVRLIDSLVADKLVQRRPNQNDGRSVVLRVTPLGDQRAQDILSARSSVIDEVLSCLTDEQKQTLIPILEAILVSQTHDYESARRNCKLCDEGVCRPQGCPVEQASMPSELG